MNEPWTTHIGSMRALVTSGETRIITERPRPTTTSHIVCAEPSPDIAKALSTLAKVSGGNGAVNVGGGISTAQSISILAGRTAGVVALRDGLFKACEAYANGAITSKSYTFILSNYGDILVTLMLAEDVAGASVNAQASNPVPTAAPALTLDFPGGSATMKSTGGATGAAAVPAPGATSSIDGGEESSNTVLAASASNFGNDATAKQPKTPPATIPAAVNPTAAPASSAAATPDSTQTKASTGDGSSSGMSAPTAINSIAKAFLVDGAPGRLFGSLIALCLSGDTPSSDLETPSSVQKDVCSVMVAELKANYAARDAAMALVDAVNLKTAMANESAAETTVEIQKIALFVAAEKAKATLAPQPKAEKKPEKGVHKRKKPTKSVNAAIVAPTKAAPH